MMEKQVIEISTTAPIPLKQRLKILFGEKVGVIARTPIHGLSEMLDANIRIGEEELFTTIRYSSGIHQCDMEFGIVAGMVGRGASSVDGVEWKCKCKIC